MNWSVLGIAPTKDKAQITAAYRERLLHVNPEDRPEEFKALRAAYEEALQLADQADAPPAQAQSPVEEWAAQLRPLYDDFAARIQPERWQALLKADVCLALDTRPLAEEALLHFLLKSYYLPQSVWQLLDSVFQWAARTQELYEAYPKDFVDYVVLNGIRYDSRLPYELFTPGQNGQDCDEYRRLYNRASQSAFADMGPILEQMAALSERHPYGEALSHRLAIANGEVEQGRAGLQKLAEAYPDDATLVLDWAAQCMQCEDWKQAEPLARHILELKPAHYSAKRALAECLAHLDRYDEAKDLMYDLMDAAGGDRRQVYNLNQVLNEWNKTLIERREAIRQERPEDIHNALELGWCYLQNNRLEDALQLCEGLPPDNEDPYDYHNLYAKVLYANERYEQSLEHLEVKVALLRSMQPDGTDKTAKRLSSLPETLQMQGSCLMELQRKEAALQKYEEALELGPEDPEVLTQMGHLQYRLKNYQRAAEVYKKLTDVLPGAYHGHYLLAMTLYELRQDKDAFESINRALELEGSDLGVYVVKMRILLRNGVWKDVHEIIDFLHKNGVKDETAVLWCEAQLFEREQKDAAKALELYETIAARLEQGEQLPWGSQVYYRLTVLRADALDARKPEDRATLLALLEKGLAQDEEDEACLDYKAWLLKKDGRYEEALAIYHKLEAAPRHPLSVEEALAEIYYQNLSRNAAKALHYYELLLAEEETANRLFYAGTCRRYLRDYEGAKKNFLRQQELEPENIDGYRGLSYVYEAMGQYEPALEQMERVIELIQSRTSDESEYYLRKILLQRRLNRPYEAIQTVNELAAKYKYADSNQLKFDICCQFGLWSQAKVIVNAWLRSPLIAEQRKKALRAKVQLYLLTGKLTAARLLLFDQRTALGPEEYERLKASLAELEGNLPLLMKDCNRRLEENRDKTHALSNMALFQYWYGSKEEARKYAQQALPLLEKLIEDHQRSETLYRSRRIVALALLGRMEEARQELAAIRTLPLCEGCDFCACQDADIYEAHLAEIEGNLALAMELYQAGNKRWPGCLDFISGIRRLKRKGYKQ